MMSLKVDIKKNLSGFTLDIQFDTETEPMAIIGPSGCGKTMTLKCIAGVEKPDSGTIVLNGRTLFDSEKKINLSPQERHVGLMFQSYALFPNMTVEENILCGARRLRNRELAKERVAAIMESFNLIGHKNVYPSHLSGGQQQRTALARILVSDPELLLLDEPFSALDSDLKERLYTEMKDVLFGLRKPVIMVTHEIKEALMLTNTVVVMREGQKVCKKTQNEVRSNYTDYLIDELRRCGVKSL